MQIVIEQYYLGVFLPDAGQQFGRRIAAADDAQSSVVPKRLHQTPFLLPADADEQPRSIRRASYLATSRGILNGCHRSQIEQAGVRRGGEPRRLVEVKVQNH